MPDMTLTGPIEQLTGKMADVLAGAFRQFPNHGPDGSVVGVPVLPFYDEGVRAWPTIVVRVIPQGGGGRSAIGNVSEVNTSKDVSPAGLPAGYTLETVIEHCVIDLRIGARNEVERERLCDWVYRAFAYLQWTPPGQAVSTLSQLGALGVYPRGLASEPRLPDMNAADSRPQGMPPWPGQLFFDAQIELSQPTPGLAATVDVAPATFAVTPTA